MTRVYVPSTLSRLGHVLAAGGIGPTPVPGHAVTEALRATAPDATEEEWEYAAMSAAAQDSVGLLGAGDPPRRVVLAVDAGPPVPVTGAEATLVELHQVVPLARVVAVHVDSADAEPVVADARDGWPAAVLGDQQALLLLDRCLDHELGWFAPQEIGALLDT